MSYAPSSLGLPRPQAIEGYVERWKPDPSKHKGLQHFPMSNHYLPVVEWDELGQIIGKTQAMAPNTEPQNIAHQILKSFTERGFFFGEAMSLTETDILNIRAAGTLDKLAGQQLVMQMTNKLQTRLDTLIEWSCWQAIQGSLAIDENGVKRTVTYSGNFAATPTAANLWSDYTAADPILDIQGWVNQFRGKAAGRIKCYYNREVAIHLSQNQTVRELIKFNAPTLSLGPDNVGQLLAPLIGGIESMEVYDEGYISAADTFSPFIASTKFIMIAAAPTGGNLGSSIGAWKTTPSVRNGGLQPKPGRWVQVFDKLENEPKPEYKQACGINGIPIIRFPRCILVATVA